MPLISTRSLILQSFPYSDSSKILRLYTLGQGLRSVIAKGAQRPRSRFGGLLEPFTEGEALIFVKENRDLHMLSGFDLVHSRQALGRDLTAFSGASLLAELLLRFGTEEPHPALYHLTSRALDRIAEAPALEVPAAALGAVWRVIGLLGYRPETESCVSCGRVILPGETARFDAQGGGVACAACRPRGRPLEALALQELRQMVSGDPLEQPLVTRATHRALLWTFLSTHLAQEQRFRSLELFMQQLT